MASTEPFLSVSGSISSWLLAAVWVWIRADARAWVACVDPLYVVKIYLLIWHRPCRSPFAGVVHC